VQKYFYHEKMMNYNNYNDITSEQKDRICDGTDIIMMIENFQRQEQLKSIDSILKYQKISDSKENNQNDENWESVQTRRKK
jgi:hypothetical protein